LTEDPGQSCSIQVFDAECVNYFLIEQLKVVHFTFFIYFNLILFLQEPRRKGGQEENEHTTRHGRTLEEPLDTVVPWCGMLKKMLNATMRNTNSLRHLTCL
jgi:hypothetical protein